MKKSFIIIAIFSVLVGVAIYFYWDKFSNPQDEKSFTTPEIGELTRIVLKDRAANVLELSKVDSSWFVNGKLPVNPVALNDILFALEFMYADYPVPANAVSNVMTQMIKNSTKVSLYKNNESTPYKVFYVGGPNHQQDGTYMLMEINGEAAEKPYVVNLPGFRGYVTYRFSTLKSPWVSAAFTKYLPDEIQSFEIEYFQEDKENSFLLSRENKGYSVQTASAKYENEAVNTVLAEQIFGAFSSLNFENYYDSIPKQDSILQNLHFLDLKLVLKNGVKHHLSVYFKPVPTNQNPLLDKEGNMLSIDNSLLYAFNHDSKTFFGIQYYTFDKLFIKSSDILKKQGPTN
jgi:hypothetical protein